MTSKKKTKTHRKRKSSQKYPRKHKVVTRKQRRTRRIRGGEVNPEGFYELHVNKNNQPPVTPIQGVTTPQGSKFSNDPVLFEEVYDEKKLLSRLQNIFKDYTLTDEKIFEKYNLRLQSYKDDVIIETLKYYNELYKIDGSNKELITRKKKLLESILNSRNPESAPPKSAPPTPTPPISFFSSITSLFKKPQ
jgi:hypothetical protein